MIDSLLWVAAGLLLLYFLLVKKTDVSISQVQPIPALRNGKLIYTDDKKSEVFYSKKHKIRTRPDFLIKMPNGDVVPIEYKSRKSGIYPSDIEQVIATVIALRDKFPSINYAYILNRSGQHKRIDCNKNTDELLERISRSVWAVRAVANRKTVMPSITSVKKCQGCGERLICSHSKI